MKMTRFTSAEVGTNSWKQMLLLFCISLLTGILVAQEQPTLGPDGATPLEDVPIEAEPVTGDGATTSASSAGSSSSGVGIPGANSSVPGANDLLNFQTDLFTGRFSYSVPIIVAPGRQSAEPKLALTYNSAAGNGWCGVGWTLEVGFIERDTKKGVPVKWGTRDPIKEYDDAAGFVFSLGGVNGSLVNVGGNVYRNEIDGTFLKFVFNENYWEVTDKSGTKFYFGQTLASRMEHPDSGWIVEASKSTFRWALNRVVDVNGNETTLTYTKVAEYLYLTGIAYNGNTSGLPATHTVEFVLETGRPDQPTSFRSNYRVKLKRLLSEVIIKVNGQRVRRYDLIYTTSPSTFRSLLQSVVLYGPDDTAWLPPLTFTYQVKPFGFENSTVWSGVNDQGQGVTWAAMNSTWVNSGIQQAFVALQDIDGDALPDRVTRNVPSPYDKYNAQRNTGSSFGPLQPWGRLTSQYQTAPDWGSVGRTDANSVTTLRFTDINGDGYPDRVMDDISSNTKFVVETNTGLQGQTGSFHEPGINWQPVEHETATTYEWAAVSAQSAVVQGNCLYSTIVDLFDINGDGLQDRVMRKESSPFSFYVLQHNTGASFTPWRRHGTLLSQGMITAPGYGGPAGRNCYVSQRYHFLTPVDLNGDGLPDRVMQHGSGGGDFAVHFNRGVDFAPTEEPWGPIDSQGQPNLGWFSDSVGWFSPYSTYVSASYEAVQCLLIDMNGDALPDRVMGKIGSPWDNFKVQFNTGGGFTSVHDFGPIEQNSTWFWAAPTWIDRVDDDLFVSMVDLVDINGDALPDRVWYESPSTWRVQLNKGPFPDLLRRIDNGIGGRVTVTHAPSTEFNNRDKSVASDPWAEGAKALLPFVVYVVDSVTTRDGFGNVSTTSYSYRGGMYDGKRREFRGFSRTTIADANGGLKRVYFHQGGGWDEPDLGEFQDNGSLAKKGIPFRILTVGTNGLTSTVTINKVEEAMLHPNGWCFPYISQTIQHEHDGLANYRATAQQFLYDTNTGNVLKVSNFGEVGSVDSASHTCADLGSDSIYTHTTYTNLGEILNKPATVKITSDDAGTIKLRETKFAYDSRGNLTNQQAWLAGTTYLTTTAIQYDPYGNPWRITDAAGITTENTYDTTYQMFVEQKVTAGFTNTFRYNPHSGAVLSATDAKGIVSSNRYDAFFRLVETSISTEADGPATLWRERYAYNLGAISTNYISYNWVRNQVYDPGDTNSGHETYIYADGLGRTIQTRADAENGQFRVSDAFYDVLGNPLFATLPRFQSGAGFTLTTGTHPGSYTEYDPFGRAFKVTPAVEAVFDSNGNFTDIYGTGGDAGSPVAATVAAFTDGTNPWATAVTDAEGKVRKSFHDAHGRTTNIVEVTSGGNYVTTYKYDKVGNLTNVIDHLGNQTRIFYDNLGRKTSMVDPDMGTWTYAYDNASRLVQQIDAKNQKIEFVYTNDPLGRLTARKIYNSNSVLVATISYVYDTNQGENGFFVPKGALFKVTDREGWTKFGYDARGRATNTTRFVNTNQASYEIVTEYDDADRVRTIKYPTATDVRLKYEYDRAGHLTNIISIAGTGSQERFYSSPVFNALGQLTSVRYGANQQVTYAYYAKSKRLTNKVVTVSTNLQNLSYQYDKVSNLKKITDAARPSGTNSASITSFTYDDLHRLTSLYSTGLNTNRNYSYNAIGNLMSNDDLPNGQYTYASGKAHQVSYAGSKAYTYDACGNMISRGYNVLQYDEENRLRQFNGPSPQLTFGYTDDGTRLWRNYNGELTVWIGGIYEQRGTKHLCHVFANGQLIATFEPQGGGPWAFIPGGPTVARAARTLERWFAWPLQNGRTPITVMIATLLGILCTSVLSRWQERIAFNRSTQRSQRKNNLCQILSSLLPSRPSVQNSSSSSLDLPRSAFRAPRFFHQALSVFLIVALVLATTETNVHAQVPEFIFYYYHPDHLGSSNIMTDRAGVIVQQHEYTAFGYRRVKTNPTAFPVTHGYTGQDFDEATGLLFYQSRYYDPEIGRFIQPDSIVPDLENPQALNRYSYVLNNPYSFTDPTGYFEEGPTWDSHYSYMDYETDVFDRYFSDVLVRDIISDQFGPIYTFIPSPVLLPIPLPSPTAAASATPGVADSLATFFTAPAGWAFDSVYNQGVGLAGLAHDTIGTSLDFVGQAFGNSNLGSSFNAWAQYHYGLMNPAARAGWYDPNNPGVQTASFGLFLLTKGRAAPGVAAKTASGQIHHAISRTVHKALEQHPNLRGVYQVRDPRFTTQAKDLASHRGYQGWHRALDVEVANWVRHNPKATARDFEHYLRNRYSQPDLKDRFPVGL